MYKCPYPGCGYVAYHCITNYHAKSHGFNTVKDMEKEYGKVKYLIVPAKISRWAKESTSLYGPSAFTHMEAMASRLKSREERDARDARRKYRSRADS